MRQGIRGLVLVGVVVCGAPLAWATTYTIDHDHSTVSFRIRHLFAYVRGTFDQFEGTFDYVPGHPEQGQATATIQAASINTRVPDRDKHLRSADFFDVETYPTMTFTSTGVSDATPTSAKLHGLLTIHGVEQPVALDLAIHGEGKDSRGNVRSGFTATTTVNRKDFGVVWNKVVEAGRLLVGDEVEITIEVEGVSKLDGS